MVAAANKILFFVLCCGCLAALVIVLSKQSIKGLYFNVLPPPKTTVSVIKTAGNSINKTEAIDLIVGNSTISSKENESIIHRQTSSDSNKYKDQTDLKIPNRAITLPYKTMMTKQWYQELTNFLSVHNNSPVVLLSCSSQIFLPVLLNWLAAYRLATGSNLSEILVVSIDDEIAHLSIIDIGLNSIFIKNNDDILTVKTRKESIWMKRIIVARIINHFGYDVLIIDLDAIYLKDFTTIIKKYNTSDIVGSMSKWPYELNSLWGFTMCMGVAYFRSSPGTETFWNSVSTFKHNTVTMQDDQIMINYGFKDLGIKWIQNQTCTAHQKKNQCLVRGETAAKVSITIVPHGVVCRHEHCFKKDVDKYYIWHVKESTGTGDFHFPSGPAWFLDKNWKAAYTKHHKPREIYKLIDEITNKTKTIIYT